MSDKTIENIVSFTLTILTLWGVWSLCSYLDVRLDSRCKAAYGQTAKSHSIRNGGECNVNGDIKALP